MQFQSCPMDESKEQKNPSPYDKANIVSRIVFWWLIPFLYKGYRRDIEEEDLHDVPINDRSEKLGNLLEREWERELSLQTDKRQPLLRRAIWRAFGVRFFFTGFLCFIEECGLHMVQPLCLAYYIRYFNPKSDMSKESAFLYASGVVAASIMFPFTHHLYFFGVMHVGMKIRIACCALIYRKAVRLSQKAVGHMSIGQLVNLLSNDVNRFDTLMYVHYTWVAPLQLVATIVLLWQQIGPASLVGVTLLLLQGLARDRLEGVCTRLRLQTAKLTDERIRIMSEVIGAMRVIKMYAWEKPFSTLIERARRREVRVITKTNAVRAVNNAIFTIASKVIMFLSLLTYIMLGYSLTPEAVFVSLSLFNSMRLVMTLFYPFGISQLAEVFVTIRRLQHFLLLEERAESPLNDSVNELEEKGIKVEGLIASWPKVAGEKPTLNNISFEVKPNQLFAVVGPVGSGKTSLLMALLRELPTTSGSIHINGKVVFSAQQPWVFQSTVRQNILLGSPYDRTRYLQVIRVCALEQDMAQLPFGDQTLVGEHGSTLSGGQKARVSLARAVYNDADIYVLDDPLSAVDASVGQHLFENYFVPIPFVYVNRTFNGIGEPSLCQTNRGIWDMDIVYGAEIGRHLFAPRSHRLKKECIQGFLKNKIRILATHQVQYLQSADTIMVLKQGDCIGLGNYLQLKNLGFDLTLILAEENGSARSPGVSETKLSTVPQRRKSIMEAAMDAKASSHHSVTKDVEEQKVAKEMKSRGSVSCKIYWRYVIASNAYCLLALLCLLVAMVHILYNGADIWLGNWTNWEEKKATKPESRAGVVGISLGDDDKTERDVRLYIYSGIVGSLFVLGFFRAGLFYYLCLLSSKNLHNRMFYCILRAPTSFFDENSSGRILNRFSSDIGLIDDILPVCWDDTTDIFLKIIGIAVIVGMVNYWSIIPLIFLGVAFLYLRSFYLASARDVKRLEGTTRSPIFTHLSTSLYGLCTIRSFGVEETFCEDFDHIQDKHSSAWFLYISGTRWLGICLDWLSIIYITIVVYLFMFIEAKSGGDVGLAIANALVLSGMFQWGVRQSAEVENLMTSVERVVEYSQIEPEAALVTHPDKAPPPNWPTHGIITFEGVTLRYKRGANPVLKNIYCCFRASEKVGIIGRTGAGKSSLISILFRLTEPEGIIRIDGINIQDLGLHELRRKISIIPQDPIIFMGSVRYNLDPIGECTEEELWHSLEDVHLKSIVLDMPKQMDTILTEGGGNLSIGQCQLICLARAILRNNKILVLDEATANVDQETDQLIQQTIRQKFEKCTVLTIAHRLNTIMDSDRILVLDDGRIAEFDEPHILLQNPNSHLLAMVQATGEPNAKYLKALATKAYLVRSSDAAKNSKQL